MKKIVLFLLVAVIAAGAVWGQAGTSIDTAFDISGRTATGRLGSFFVPNVVSTQSRYSAGIFTSYADDFVWFTSYDPKVGTYILLGGYPQTAADVASTNYQSSTTVVSFGLGKTLKAGYLGLYYRGHLLDADGTDNGLKGDESDVMSESTWNNGIAILYGNEKIGAIRFDIFFSPSFYEHDVDGKPKSTPPDPTDPVGTPNNPGKTVTNPPRFAFGWGKTLAKETEFYAQLGYRFPTETVNTSLTNKDTDTIWGTSRLQLQAGIYKPLASKDKNTESSLSFDFLIGNIFGEKGEGDLALKDHPYVRGGQFFIEAEVGIKNTINVDDKLSVGFKPSATIGFRVDDSRSTIDGKDKFDAAKITLFEIDTGINLGVKYKATKKATLYTGVGFDIISFTAGGYSEGKDQKYDKDNTDPTKKNLAVKSSAWEISGISARSETLHSGTNLGFGLTYEPSKNLEIGLGISSLLDRIVRFNVAEMRLETGLNNAGTTESGWLFNNTLANLQFDLTIGMKF